MSGLDRVGSGERGDRRSNACDPRPPASGERQLLDRSREQRVGLLVSSQRVLGESRARRCDAFAHRRRTLTLARREVYRARPRDHDNEIEPIEERTGKLVAVRGEPLCGARARDRRISPRTAGTEIHRPDELERRRVERSPFRSGDADHAVLERLSQCLERWADELGQLIEQQHPVVREARLAGSRTAPTADDRRRGGGVVRRAKRRARDERVLDAEDSCDRVDPCHLERRARVRAAARARATGARASSSRCRVGRPAEGCAVRPPRSPAHGGLSPGRGRRRDPAKRSERRRSAVGWARARARRGGRRPPRRGARPAPARSLRARPRAPSARRR